jgi:hypothetical protein
MQKSMSGTRVHDASVQQYFFGEPRCGQRSPSTPVSLTAPKLLFGMLDDFSEGEVARPAVTYNAFDGRADFNS